MQALFLCFYTPGIAHYAERALEINRRYCEKWGYDIVAETDNDKIIKGCEGRAVVWYYFKMLEEHFGRKDVEWIVKIDCDAVAVGTDRDLACWFEEGADLVYATDNGPDVINAGVQLIRNDEVNREFYRRTWEAAERLGRGLYKTAPWHEQTLLSAACLLKGKERPNIRIVPNGSKNSFNCFHEHQLADCIFFHDNPKQRIARFAWEPSLGRYVLPPISASASPLAPARPVLPAAPDAPASAVVAPMPKNAPVGVVYYAYLVNEWKSLVSEQIGHLKASGLFAAAKAVWVVSSGTAEAGQELKDLVGPHSKITFQHSTDNRYEFPALERIKDIADNGDWKLLYFHTKGVANNYKTAAGGEVSERKVAGAKNWRRFMEHFLVGKWRHCVEKLDENDMVVAFFNRESQWPWGNFWWATSSHIKTCVKPEGGDRWYCEGWACTRGKRPKIHEFAHLQFDFHYSDFPAFLYDGSRDLEDDRICIKKAEYGTLTIQTDECSPPPPERHVAADVTERVASVVSAAGGRTLVLNASNDSLGGDPAFGVNKVLEVWWCLEKEPEKVYRLCAPEGLTIQLELRKIS